MNNLKNLKTQSGELSQSFKDTAEDMGKLRMAIQGLVQAMDAGNVKLAKSYEEKLKEYYSNQSNKPNYVESKGNNVMFNLNDIFGKGSN